MRIQIINKGFVAKDINYNWISTFIEEKEYIIGRLFGAIQDEVIGVGETMSEAINNCIELKGKI